MINEEKNLELILINNIYDTIFKQFGITIKLDDDKNFNSSIFKKSVIPTDNPEIYKIDDVVYEKNVITKFVEVTETTFSVTVTKFIKNLIGLSDGKSNFQVKNYASYEILEGFGTSKTVIGCSSLTMNNLFFISYLQQYSFIPRSYQIGSHHEVNKNKNLKIEITTMKEKELETLEQFIAGKVHSGNFTPELFLDIIKKIFMMLKIINCKEKIILGGLDLNNLNIYGDEIKISSFENCVMYRDDVVIGNQLVMMNKQRVEDITFHYIYNRIYFYEDIKKNPRQDFSLIPNYFLPNFDFSYFLFRMIVFVLSFDKDYFTKFQVGKKIKDLVKYIFSLRSKGNFFGSFIENLKREMYLVIDVEYKADGISFSEIESILS